MMTELDFFIMTLLVMGIVIICVFLWRIIKGACPDE